jgi:hypothetical protein
MARLAERCRHHGRKEAAGRHSDQPDGGHAACAETIRQASGRHAGQRGDQRTDRQDEPERAACPSPIRLTSVAVDRIEDRLDARDAGGGEPAALA